MDGLRIAACCLSFLSLLLLIIALASDYWVEILKIHFGLWQRCDATGCISLGMGVEASIHATRAFLLIGMFAGFVSFFGLCASFFHTHIGSISIKSIAMMASFVAGVCSMIAMASFTGQYNYAVSLFFGWSFSLGWASFPLFLITGGLAYKPESTTA